MLLALEPTPESTACDYAGLLCEERVNLQEFPPFVDGLGCLKSDVTGTPKTEPKLEREERLERGPKDGKRVYKSYCNDDKISYLKLAKRVGYKKAALAMAVSWSTAKTWVKKDEALRRKKSSLTQQLLGKPYFHVVAQGDKRKLGVGRKITYERQVEEQILAYAMVARESPTRLSIHDLKLQAIQIVQANVPHPRTPFKGSDGWAKKFCKRNQFDTKNVFNCPKFLPKYCSHSLAV